MNYSAGKSKSKLKNKKRINIRGLGRGKKKWREGAEIEGLYELNRVFNTRGNIFADQR